MSFITVTKTTNVKEITEDGEINLIDESDIGYIKKIHSSVVTIADDQGNPTLGFIMRAEVYWENRRSPSPFLEDPNELTWLSLGNESDEEEEEDYSDVYSDDADSQDTQAVTF